MDIDKEIEQMVAKGAAIVPKLGMSPLPVGFMRRGPGHVWFWFEAGRDDEFGSHIFTADRVAVVYDGVAIRFELGGDFAAYLSTFDHGYDGGKDADDATVGFRAWRAEFETDEQLRSFVERQFAAFTNADLDAPDR